MSMFTGSVLVKPGWARNLPTPWLPDALLVMSAEQTTDGFVPPVSGEQGAISIGTGSRVGAKQGCSGIGSFPIPFFGTGNNASRRTATDRILCLGRGGDISSANRGIKITAWNRCGIAMTELDTGQFRAHYMAFAGATLKASAGTFTVPSGGGNVSVTGLDFDPAHPSLLICHTSFGTAGADNAQMSLGFSTGPGTDLCSVLSIPYNSWGMYSDSTGNIVDSTIGNAALLSFDADGFTITQPSPRGSNYVVCYLLLNDIDADFEIGSIGWPGGGGHVNAGMYPQGVFFHDTRSGAEATGASLMMGMLGERKLASTMGGNSVSGGGEPRIWTAEETVNDSLIDYVGSTRTLMAEFQPGPITLDGFDTNGYSTGSERNINWAAFRTSNPDLNIRCKQPQIWRY